MSTAVDRVLVCKRKKVFLTEEDAWGKAVSETLKRQRCMYYYHCPFCKGYHLTKKSKPGQKQQLEAMLLQQRKQKEERQAPKKKMRRIRQQYLRGEISLEEYRHYGQVYDQNPSKL